jgi:hypothetical protein
MPFVFIKESGWEVVEDERNRLKTCNFDFKKKTIDSTAIEIPK